MICAVVVVVVGRSKVGMGKRKEKKTIKKGLSWAWDPYKFVTKHLVTPGNINRTTFQTHHLIYHIYVYAFKLKVKTNPSPLPLPSEN